MTTPSTSANRKNPLGAAQEIVGAVSGMPKEEQILALKFAAEVLHISFRGDESSVINSKKVDSTSQSGPSTESDVNSATTDIRTFTTQKSPRSDQQFAAIVAYYYQFVAPSDERKESVDPEIMKEAARQAGRPQVKRWAMTLTNAKNAGYLDSVGAGKYRLNAVGENLVAITLPDNSPPKAVAKRKSAKKKPSSPRGKPVKASKKPSK